MKRVEAVARKAAASQHEEGTKRKVQLRGYPATPFQVAGSESEKFAYMAVPVTLALPPQDPKIAPYMSDDYRPKRKVVVTGVTLSFTVTSVFSFQVSAVLYAVPRMGIPAESEYDSRKIPTAFFMGTRYKLEDGEVASRLMTLEETGFTKNRDGPYEVIVGRGNADQKTGEVPYEFSLASGDGSIYDCPISRGANAPKGTVDFAVGNRGESGYEKFKKCRTVNHTVNIPHNPDGLGLKKQVKMHWELDEAVEFVMEDSQEVTMSQYLQVMVMVRSQASFMDGPKSSSFTAGHVSQALATIFFKS